MFKPINQQPINQPVNQPTKFCSDCGAQIKHNAEICPTCGMRQTRAPLIQNIKGLIILGYILTGFGLFIPLVGLAGAGVGVYLLIRGQTNHGIAQTVLGIVLGTIGWLFGMLLMSSL